VTGGLEGLLEEARAELPRAVALRRRIHKNPELGLELPETTAAVLESLAPLGLEVSRSRATSGFVARLRGARPGPSVLLRADMDALPMPENTGLAFASRHADRMHACGHDAHTAMLASAARVLHRRRESLAGDVLFLFQPGEEGFAGARVMLGEKLFEPGEVKRAFALHVDPRLTPGCVVSRPGALMASGDSFSIEVTGRGGHASMPHDALDPIPVACEIVTALQSFVTRRVDAFDPIVITVTRMRAGTTGNVIPETAELMGTIRATSARARERGHAGIRQVAEGVASAHGAKANVALMEGYPVTVNDAAQLAFARGVAVELLGERAFHEMPAPVMGAEDFSFVLEQIPGAMLFLGAGLGEPSLRAPCHSNRMQLDEDAMAAGIALHAALALRSQAS
jgi:hippurate hydrolase